MCWDGTGNYPTSTLFPEYSLEKFHWTLNDRRKREKRAYKASSLKEAYKFYASALKVTYSR
jgi:hypothetical protein